ncbi:MAG: hypothetical protein P1V81_09540 [Planctomycetota bacterium]|nr:hypothetical protein [Planctomycetota bacterium]
MRNLIILSLLVCVACPGGSDLGTELSRDLGDHQATMFHTASVDAELADAVLDALVKVNYNFRGDRPEQLDRVNGRLVLRLANDNEDAIAEVLANGEDDGNVMYMHQLAREVSKVAGGEPVDIVLCHLTVDEPYYTVAWTEL